MKYSYSIGRDGSAFTMYWKKEMQDFPKPFKQVADILQSMERVMKQPVRDLCLTLEDGTHLIFKPVREDLPIGKKEE